MSSYFLKFRLPVLAYLILIFILSSISRLDTPEIGLSFTDKWIHFLEYSVLGFLLIRNFQNETNKKLQNNAFLITFLFGTFYGASDEIHQFFVPNRSCDIFDWFADTCGILLGIFVWKLYQNFRLSSTEKI